MLNATEGSNELFFVARGEGRHLFSNTYKEHLANIAAVRPPPKPDTTAVAVRDTAIAKGAFGPAEKPAGKPATKATGKGGTPRAAPPPRSRKAAGTR